MKDIIIDPVQIDAGADMGADAVLFIAAIFKNRLARASLEQMFSRAHGRGLEVLFEAHTEDEYKFALESEADVVGINNRDLGTLEVAPRDLEEAPRGQQGEAGAPQGDGKGQTRHLGERHQDRSRHR